MTEQRQKLLDRFDKWLDSKPRKQIISAQCANIAEEYAEEQLRLHNVSQQRELLVAFAEWILISEEDITSEMINKDVNTFLETTCDKAEPLIIEMNKDHLVELFNFAYEQAVKTGKVDELKEIDGKINGC